MIKYNDFFKKNLASYKDWPKQGVTFMDINPILSDPYKLANLMGFLYTEANDFLIKIKDDIDKVIAVESRGFIYGMPIAKHLAAGFVPVRKPGKLPGLTFSQSYALEYGTDTLEIQKNSIDQGDKCLIVDDLLATGGTLKATKDLVEKCGGEVVGALVVINLKGIPKPKEVSDMFVISLYELG